jgi:hypothetical protein
MEGARQARTVDPDTVIENYSEVKAQIALIVQLENTDDWEIVDKLGALYVIHYTEDADIRKLWWVRGLIVDLESGTVIGDSFGYTSYAVLPQLTNENGQLVIEDVDAVKHSFDLDSVVIKVSFEGVVLRIFWHGGKAFKVTHRKVNTKGSRWGSSRPFLEMYDSANGPKPEDLFDCSKPYSSTLYMFMVVDPDLITATRQRVEVSYPVYIAKMSMNLNRPAEKVAPGHYVAPIIPMEEAETGKVSHSYMRVPPCLTLEQGNAHLRQGYYEQEAGLDVDPRLGTGEALIIYRTAADGHVEDVVKVYSPAFDYRFNLRGNNANLLHQFHILTDQAGHGELTLEQWRAFSTPLIMFPLYSRATVKELYHKHGAILYLPPQSGKVTVANYPTRKDRIHVIWLNFVLALPHRQQATALNFLDKYQDNLLELAQWLKDFEAAHPKELLNDTVAEPQLLTFLQEVRTREIRSRAKPKRRRSISTVIDHCLEQSYGGRIYLLTRIMERNKMGVMLRKEGQKIAGAVPGESPISAMVAELNVQDTVGSSVISVTILDQLFAAAEPGKDATVLRTLLDEIFNSVAGSATGQMNILNEIFSHGQALAKSATAAILAQMFRSEHSQDHSLMGNDMASTLEPSIGMDGFVTPASPITV